MDGTCNKHVKIKNSFERTKVCFCLKQPIKHDGDQQICLRSFTLTISKVAQQKKNDELFAIVVEVF